MRWRSSRARSMHVCWNSVPGSSEDRNTARRHAAPVRLRARRRVCERARIAASTSVGPLSRSGYSTARRRFHKTLRNAGRTWRVLADRLLSRIDHRQSHAGRGAGSPGTDGPILAGGTLVVGSTWSGRRTLVRAYDDAGGVTAAFNLNLLGRINRELGRISTSTCSARGDLELERATD